ncbi:alpha/beta fold hydrolase [Leptospira mtsangambouensis]|uniref:alpha/beta fold hydrolase n=1 Tax=Leptospira mtsangambouensis TaxID=2484912 RepID=UPI003134612F
MKTFILLHGSYHGAWNWHKIVPLLQQLGHQAISIDMPGHGLDRKKIHSTTLNDYVNKNTRGDPSCRRQSDFTCPQPKRNCHFKSC